MLAVFDQPGGQQLSAWLFGLLLPQTHVHAVVANDDKTVDEELRSVTLEQRQHAEF